MPGQHEPWLVEYSLTRLRTGLFFGKYTPTKSHTKEPVRVGRLFGEDMKNTLLGQFGQSEYRLRKGMERAQLKAEIVAWVMILSMCAALEWFSLQAIVG
jgi:hypothetical protein